MNYRFIANMLFSAFLLSSIAAAVGTLFVKVYDCDNSMQLPSVFAQVSSANPASQQAAYSLYTDSFGEARLDNLQAGAYNLAFSLQGYASKNLSFSIFNGKDNVLSTCLQQTPCDFIADTLQTSCSFNSNGQGMVSFKLYNPSFNSTTIQLYASSPIPLSISAQQLQLNAGEARVIPITYTPQQFATGSMPIIVSLASSACKKVLQIPACQQPSSSQVQYLIAVNATALSLSLQQSSISLSQGGSTYCIPFTINNPFSQPVSVSMSSNGPIYSLFDSSTLVIPAFTTASSNVCLQAFNSVPTGNYLQSFTASSMQGSSMASASIQVSASGSITPSSSAHGFYFTLSPDALSLQKCQAISSLITVYNTGYSNDSFTIASSNPFNNILLSDQNLAVNGNSISSSSVFLHPLPDSILGNHSVTITVSRDGVSQSKALSVNLQPGCALYDQSLNSSISNLNAKQNSTRGLQVLQANSFVSSDKSAIIEVALVYNGLSSQRFELKLVELPPQFTYATDNPSIMLQPSIPRIASFAVNTSGNSFYQDVTARIRIKGNGSELYIPVSFKAVKNLPIASVSTSNSSVSSPKLGNQSFTGNVILAFSSISFEQLLAGLVIIFVAASIFLFYRAGKIKKGY